MTKVNVQIPFCGYYDSKLSDAIDYAYERFTDELEDWNRSEFKNWVDPELREKINAICDTEDYRKAIQDQYNHIDYHHTEVNQYWVDCINDCYKEVYGIDLAIDPSSVEMSSPKFYNFETDSLFANVDLNALRALYMQNKDKVNDYIFKRMLPRDGFIPFFSNDPKDYGHFDDWTPVQYGLILEALYNDTIDYMMDDCITDCINEIIGDAIDCTIEEFLTDVLETYNERISE